MVEDKGGEFWLDAERPPVPKPKPGFIRRVIGFLRLRHADPRQLEELRKMPGVDTNLVERNGEQGIEVTVNSMVPPEPKKKR